jgi:hypothetical protein
MGKITRFAFTLGLTLAAGANVGLAHAAPDDDEAASSTSSAARSAADQSSGEQTPEEKLAKRRERLQQGATRLRERAAEMRKKAAAGETPKSSPNAKRPPRSFEEQAQRLEEQATKMEDRAKNLTAADVATAPGGDRAASSRKKRHQVRRIQLNRRWGDTLKDPEAIAELKLHAERAAKLKRIRTLALKKSKDDPVAERASKLLAREVARHELHMKELQAKAVAASVGTAPAAAPAEGSTTPSATAPAGEATK